MSLPFTQGPGSSRAHALESITVCTEILGDPQRVGEVLQILYRTSQRVPGNRMNRPCRPTRVE